ncbi:MAG: azurin [Bacteroidetes bacterium]|jgi:azurin|nr:azurin [Bacteroidota bacterium]
MKKSILVLASAALFLAACNSSTEQKSSEPAAPAETTTPAAAPAPAPTEPAIVTLNAGDDMKYDITEIKVKAGQTVKLTLHHTGKLPITGMGHNFVLLASGVDENEFAQAALKAKDTDYIPADHADDIIAHTKLIGGGESTEIEFTAPEKGTYDYLCSFPGHHAMMHGKFIVE